MLELSACIISILLLNTFHYAIYVNSTTCYVTSIQSSISCTTPEIFRTISTRSSFSVSLTSELPRLWHNVLKIFVGYPSENSIHCGIWELLNRKLKVANALSLNDLFGMVNILTKSCTFSTLEHCLTKLSSIPI